MKSTFTTIILYLVVLAIIISGGMLSR